MLVAQLDRVFGYEPKGRGFESLQAHHVGTDFAPFRFFYAEKSVTRAVVPPFSQKGTLGSPVRLQARSLTAHCRYHLFARAPAAQISQWFGFPNKRNIPLRHVPFIMITRDSNPERAKSEKKQPAAIFLAFWCADGYRNAESIWVVKQVLPHCGNVHSSTPIKRNIENGINAFYIPFKYTNILFSRGHSNPLAIFSPGGFILLSAHICASQSRHLV